ncbi:MAG: tetratricopeptide repeat protein [Alphaproteobacteria bacterium]|nr:tetratricopeptide repeat protein [Alphaproteobacteria bacterium]
MTNMAAASATGEGQGGGPVRMKLADAVKQAQSLCAKGQLDAAEKIALAVLQKQPKQPQTMQVLASIAEQRGDPKRAIHILREALTGAQTDALALMNLCRAYRMQGQLKESRDAGEKAVRIGTVPDAIADLGDTYTAMGEHDLALQAFEHAVARRPQLPRAHLGLAHALLMKGEFRSGWAEYEWRYKLANTKDILPKFKQPVWNGMPLKASRLLVICEQGFGDCFQFARYLPMVRERVASVVIGTGPEIRSIMSNVAGEAYETHERWENLPPFHYQIAISSLPMVFGTTLETIPSKVPYLSADPAKAAAWRTRLDAAAQGRKKVGLVWQGRPAHPNDRVRSVGLGALTPLLQIENILPVSLQFGAGQDQLAKHPARARVLDVSGEIKDFGDTAAAIAGLDCVVTIDSAIAHLAGAMGKPTFVMLSHAGEWRWLEKRTDSPWYPTLALIRQTQPGAWDGVVQRIAERLRA